jgi:hypothetical protein
MAEQLTNSSGLSGGSVCSERGAATVSSGEIVVDASPAPEAVALSGGLVGG